MANLDLAALTGALAQEYRPRTIRSFNAKSVLLRILEKRKAMGKNCAWTWEGTGAIAENHTDGQDVSNYGVDTKNTAVLTWGLYRTNVTVTDQTASVAAASGSPADLVMAAAREFENCNRKLAATINDEGYNGLGTGTLICGLDVALDDANNYAGVDRSQAANAGFRAKVIDPGVPTAPSLALLRSDISSIYDACGEAPPIALCASAVWNKLASLFQEFRRYNQDVNVGGRTVHLDASVSALELDGCIFIKDKDATANQIYYINPDYVRWEYMPFAGMEPLMAQMREQAIDDGYGAMPLGMLWKPLAVTGAAQKMTGQVQLQLQVEHPKACGIRKNVLTT